MTLDLTAHEVLTTTRSVRKRLDLDPPRAHASCSSSAWRSRCRHPPGSNSQGWAWMFVEDPAKKQAIADIYRRGFTAYRQRPRSAEYPEGDLRAQHRDAVTSSADYLSEHFHEVPVMLIPLIEGRLDDVAVVQRRQRVGIDPPRGVELHARARDCGAWAPPGRRSTSRGEREVADLLGIPFDRYTQAGLFPVAYTIGTDFKPAARLPAADLVHFDSW